MVYSAEPKGVCSRKMSLELVNGRIKWIKVEGGCNGNLQALCRVLEGADAGEAMKRLKGIRCGSKETSCPDQMAKIIREAYTKEYKEYLRNSKQEG